MKPLQLHRQQINTRKGSHNMSHDPPSGMPLASVAVLISPSFRGWLCQHVSVAGEALTENASPNLDEITKSTGSTISFAETRRQCDSVCCGQPGLKAKYECRRNSTPLALAFSMISGTILAPSWTAWKAVLCSNRACRPHASSNKELPMFMPCSTCHWACCKKLSARISFLLLAARGFPQRCSLPNSSYRAMRAFERAIEAP